MLKYWIIERKSDGAYLPNPQGRRGRGGTHVEPVSGDCQQAWPPRLFHKRSAARRALTCWLQGRTTVSYGRSYSEWGDDDYEDWHTEKAPERRREDWHVVPVTISFGRGDDNAV